MMKIIYLFLFSILSLSATAGVYPTPGTGVNWSLSDLVSNSGGIVTFNGSEYTFTDSVTVSTGDILRIETDATVKFNAQVVLRINGTLIINPPNGVLFSPVSTASPFRGVWLENSVNSVIRKLTYEYASSFRLSDSSPLFEDCVFQNNNSATTLANGTLSLFRSSPVVNNCSFINNYRAAVQGGANIANAPKFFNCTFSGNNINNLNVPHINLGASGTDTTKIIGCTITSPAGIRTGGIGFLPLGTLNTLIQQNHIAGNRYGISLQGGSDINAMVRYNYIGFNNIENNPAVGGSGIAFAGGSASSHQNSIVTGNVIEGNLWGITIYARNASGPLSGSMPNLGNLLNADTSDNGKNWFKNNTNTTTPGIDLYNNSADPIFAMGNYWNTEIESEIEGKIFHNVDDATLGLANFSQYIMPVELLSFTATKAGNSALLRWQTAQETNSESFVIERSTDAVHFLPIGTVAAAGQSNQTLSYQFTDSHAAAVGVTVFYRLKMLDTDGSFSYSAIKTLSFDKNNTSLLRYYPSMVVAGETVTIEWVAHQAGPLHLQWIDALGRTIENTQAPVQAGFNRINVTVPHGANKGVLMVKLKSDNANNSIKLIKK